MAPGDAGARLCRERAQPRLDQPALQPVGGQARSAQHGLKLVYAAVAAVIGLQLIGDDAAAALSPSATIAQTGLVLRITTAAGALVLVHNIYGQAAPASRSHIRFAMLGLALIWIYDLNLYTVLYLGSAQRDPADRMARACRRARGAAVRAGDARARAAWRVRLSRAATFQSLSLLAICAYFALMAILATALRGTGVDWSSALMVGVLAVMTVGAMVLIPSARARGWVKVKLAKHLFEHRYDYRTEWLRFTETLGRAGPDAPPLSERIVKAFADIVDAPGGLLLVSDGGRGLAVAAALELARQQSRPPTRSRMPATSGASSRRAAAISSSKALRDGWASAEDKALHVPHGCSTSSRAWAGIPLLHQQRLVGLVVLAAPELPPAARLGGFRPAPHRRQPGGELARRGAGPGSARPTRSGSRNSTAASPSSSTTSRIWSASCRCSRAMPSGTPTIRSSAPTWSRRCKSRSAR